MRGNRPRQHTNQPNPRQISGKMSESAELFPSQVTTLGDEADSALSILDLGLKPSAIHRREAASKKKRGSSGRVSLWISLVILVVLLLLASYIFQRDTRNLEEDLATVQNQNSNLSTTVAVLGTDIAATDTLDPSQLSPILPSQVPSTPLTRHPEDGTVSTPATETPSLQPTETPSPTTTKTPSPTLTSTVTTTPTYTLTATYTPSPTPIVSIVSEIVATSANVRKFPGTNYDILTTLTRNTCIELLGQFENPDDAQMQNWVQIRISTSSLCVDLEAVITDTNETPAETGWLARDFVLIPEGVELPFINVEFPAPLGTPSLTSQPSS